MAKIEGEEILRELLTLEVEDEGQVYVIDFFEDFDLTRVGANINSIAAKIAYLEKVCARLKREVSDLKAERDEWIAQEDKEVRAMRQFRKGEAKITQEIRRHPEWLQYLYRINAAEERYDVASGFLRALYVTSDLLRTKDSTYRKHEQLTEPVEEYRSAKRFNIEKVRREKVREKIRTRKKGEEKKKKKALKSVRRIKTPVEE